MPVVFPVIDEQRPWIVSCPRHIGVLMPFRCDRLQRNKWECWSSRRGFPARFLRSFHAASREAPAIVAAGLQIRGDQQIPEGTFPAREWRLESRLRTQNLCRFRAMRAFVNFHSCAIGRRQTGAPVALYQRGVPRIRGLAINAPFFFGGLCLCYQSAL